MTFTYTLSTDIGKARLYSGDTNSGNAAFSDEELQIFIDGSTSSNVRLASAWALRSLALDTARMGRWAEAKVDADAAADMAVELAEFLESQASSVDGISVEGSSYYLVSPFSGGISDANKEVYEDDTDRVKPAFSTDMHRYPESD
jgi:hypothetical protein